MPATTVDVTIIGCQRFDIAFREGSELLRGEEDSLAGLVDERLRPCQCCFRLQRAVCSFTMSVEDVGTDAHSQE